MINLIGLLYYFVTDRLAAQDIKKSSEKSKGKKSEDDEDEALPPPAADKFGLCGINMGVSRPHNELFSYTPLHIAAQYGNLVSMTDELSNVFHIL